MTWIGFPLLLAATALLCLLPLLPALLELRRKTDVAPLTIVRAHDGNVRYFARQLRASLASQLPRALPPGEGSAMVEGRLSDGTPFCWVRAEHCGVRSAECGLADKDRPAAAAAVAGNPHSALRTPHSPDCLLISEGPLALPPGSVYPREVYAGDTLEGGAGNRYTGLLGEQAITLAAGSVVTRWLHGETTVHLERNCQILGRASAEQSLHLAEGCTFARLHAARIEFGVRCSVFGVRSSDQSPHTEHRTPNTEHRTRRLVRGDLALAAGECVDGDLVVHGRLVVGAGAVIRGSVKTHGLLHLKAGARVEGSAVSAGDIRIEAGCRLHGPVIAEGEITTTGGCELGRPHSPTTVSAPRLRISPGVVAYGTVWARERGAVSVMT